MLSYQVELGQFCDSRYETEIFRPGQGFWVYGI